MHALKSKHGIELGGSDWCEVTPCKFMKVTHTGNTRSIFNSIYAQHVPVNRGVNIELNQLVCSGIFPSVCRGTSVHSRYAVVSCCAVPSFCLQQSASPLLLLNLFVSSSLYSSSLPLLFCRAEALVTDEWRKKKKEKQPNPIHALFSLLCQVTS